MDYLRRNRMDVVINSDSFIVPEYSKLLMSQGTVFLNLLFSMGYDPLNPPAADLLRQLKHLDDGNWLVLSPMHWQASHNDAFIVATGKELHLSDTESKAWFKLFSDHLAHDGFTLDYYNNELWLICINQRPAVNAKPVYHLLNKSLMPELAVLDPSMYWQKFITESQMFFASTPNHTSINGVWLWGGAKLTKKNSISICTDEQLLALATICSTNVSLYNPSIELKKFDILLLSDFDILSAQHKKELNKKSINWYWNNSAYTRSDKNWITRLWRNLIHAH